MQKTNTSANHKVWEKINTMGKAAALGAGITFFGYFTTGNASAQAISKSSASTFYDNVPGLSLAPSTFSLSKSMNKKGYGVFANCKLSESTGIHAMRVVTPSGPAIDEVGIGVGSKRLDLGFAVDEIKGENVVIGGMTFRATNEIAANLVVSTGKDGKLNWALNTDVAVSNGLNISARMDSKNTATGVDGVVVGFMPSASVTFTGNGAKVDANVWSPKMGPGGKVRVAGIWNGIGGENTVGVQFRISP